jgi:hypothetical protein
MPINSENQKQLDSIPVPRKTKLLAPPHYQSLIQVQILKSIISQNVFQYPHPHACEEPIGLRYAGILLECGQRIQINSPSAQLRCFPLTIAQSYQYP